MKKNLPQAFSSVRDALKRRGRTEHEAEDLVQEAWLRMTLYERDHVVEQPEAFLMRTALNLSINVYRAQLNHGEVVMLEDEVLVDTAPSTESLVLGRERVARLQVCLARLTERTREIFLAHRLDGLTYRELGEQFGLSTSTVEKHVSKATEQLLGWMEEW